MATHPGIKGGGVGKRFPSFWYLLTTLSKKMTILPRELLDQEDQVRFAPQDLTKIRNDPRKTVAVSQLHVGRYATPILLKGELTTEGITFTDHEEYGPKYSFGIRLEDPQDVEGIQALLEADRLDSACHSDEQDTWETLPVFKGEGDVLYLKVKPNGTGQGFTFTSNLKLGPKKPNTEIFRFMPIEVEVMVGTYFNVRENTRGIYFTVRHIEFKKMDPTLRDASTQTEAASPVTTQSERQPKRMGGSSTGPTTRSGRKGAHVVVTV